MKTFHQSLILAQSVIIDKGIQLHGCMEVWIVFIVIVISWKAAGIFRIHRTSLFVSFARRQQTYCDNSFLWMAIGYRNENGYWLSSRIILLLTYGMSITFTRKLLKTLENCTLFASGVHNPMLDKFFQNWLEPSKVRY